MSNLSSNNKRIAKNTLFLYVRMLFLMFISLYTSRVVLDKLGVEDFGIFNVVGGLAAMFTFFSSSLSNATQRFLNIELGQDNLNGAKNVFSQYFLFYCIIAIVVIVAAETIGLWFVWNKLVIPPDRVVAAVCVYQFTVLSLCITLIGIVFNSEIVVHENMRIYSYIGIFEGVAKLAVAFLISVSPFDRLIVYGLLLLITTLAVQGYYAYYGLKHYEECQIRFIWDRVLLKKTSSIVGWNMISTAVEAVNDSGVNVLLNIFFGPTVNAARAVSYQVSSAVNSFVVNFFTAVRPQLMKSYASGDRESLIKLFFNSTKFSFMLLWVLCLPIFFSIDTILHMWLTEVPEYTNTFTLWILAYSLVIVFNNPVWPIVLAIGDLKRYVPYESCVSLMIFPLSYVALRSGCSPVIVFVIMFGVKCCYVVVVLTIINRYIHFSGYKYLRNVILPIVKVVSASSFIAYGLSKILPATLPYIILLVFLIVSLALAVIWIFGITHRQRRYLITFLKSKLSKK